ncbi:MAG: PVC-type heme-binding CxxCH protein [Planctomycetota bacterium]|nr:PVC-type heme-binding CxxCH protein [Planctomycetota bacterium]
MLKRFLNRSLLLFGLFWLGIPAAQAQRNLKDIPDSDPEVERKSFILADGFEVNLFAGDPQIAKPIQMNFDEKGRLWIAGSSVYPHIKPGQKAEDKILILEDTDGDGQSDKTTVFAEGLLIPTGIAPAPGGCYVANSTELIHLIDTDGDDRADQKKIVLSGFGTEDTHHLLHTLRWGHDGCLYMNQSIYIHSHVETPYGVKRLNGGGIWRFRPETLELDILCEGFVNPWGHHFDRWGQNFATDGAYGEGINYVFPGSVFVTAPGKKRILKGLNPGSPKHCGLEIIGGGHLPDEFEGNMITNDFRANRVCRFVVSENGTSAFSSRQETELIKTRHVAFRPIDVKMGPDGAIYIADWYNPIIQHGEVDFRDPRRDHVHGRIWRLTYKGRKTLKLPDISNGSVEQLLGMLKAKEEWVRLHAKRKLKEKPAGEVTAKLSKWVNELSREEPGFDHHMLEALWTSQSIRMVNEPLLEFALDHPDHRLRAAGIRVAVEWRNRLQKLKPFDLFSDAVVDDHPRVRLEGVRALSLYPRAQAVSNSLKALDRPMDFYLDFALWKTVRQLREEWLPRLTAGEFDFNDNLDQLTFALRAVDSPQVVSPLMKLAEKETTPIGKKIDIFSIIGAQGDPATLGRIASFAIELSSRDPGASAKIIRQLSDSCRQRNIRPKASGQAIVDLCDNQHPPLSNAAIEAIGIWKIGEGRARLTELARQNSLTAIDGLALLGGKESRTELISIASSDRPVIARQRAANVLTMIDRQAAAEQAVQLMVQPPQDLDVKSLIDFLVKTRGGPEALIQALQSKTIAPDAAKEAVRASQASPTPSPKLIAQFRRAGELDAAKWTPSANLTQALLNEVRETGNPQAGEKIYRRENMQCAKCHAIAGAGGIVGPELNSIGASAQVDYLIESLLEPNKKVKENFHSRVVQTIDGLQYSGVPIREDARETVLRTAEGKVVTIPADDIEAKKEGRSLMPEGLVDPLTRKELVDLVSFLSQLGKVGEYAIGKQQFARNWETLTWTADAHRALNRTSFDTAATDHQALVWRNEYALVNGSVDVMSLPEYQIHGRSPKSSFLKTTLRVEKAGKVVLEMGPLKGTAIWIDGKPRKIEKRLQLDLSKGQHVLNFSVNREVQKTFRVELIAAESTAARFE